MKKIEKGIFCNVCGCCAYLIHKGTRDNPNVNVYECSNCGTKQLDVINDNDYKHGFMHSFHKFSHNDIINRLNNCQKDDKRRAKDIYRWCKNKEVCDFGCGFGGFLSHIVKATKNVYGVELGDIERDYLKRSGYDVRSSIDEFNNLFDVITLFHVFEHLKNPEKWLRTLASHLTKGGRLFIEVPNANDALLSLYNNKKFADFTYWSAHLYLYTIQGLEKIIKDNGLFEIESKQQIQRYPLSNHLYWLTKGLPGGDNEWKNIFNSEKLDKEYKKVLEQNFLCDTLFFRLRKK